jgi:hypothetical protein
MALPEFKSPQNEAKYRNSSFQWERSPCTGPTGSIQTPKLGWPSTAIAIAVRCRGYLLRWSKSTLSSKQAATPSDTYRSDIKPCLTELGQVRDDKVLDFILPLRIFHYPLFRDYLLCMRIAFGFGGHCLWTFSSIVPRKSGTFCFLLSSQ